MGNPVIYVGARTGRDGIHGASMASAGVHRGIEAEAAQRAGGRSVHGKAAARGLPGGHAHRRDRRHSGYGRGGADLLHLRDGQPRRSGHRNRTGSRAAARNRHDALRDHAFRIAGAHAAGGQKRAAKRKFIAVFRKWGLDAVEIGVVTDDGKLRVRQHGEVVAEIPNRELADEAPLYDRPHTRAAAAAPMCHARASRHGKLQDALPVIACRARCLFQALDLGAIRLSGPHQYAGRTRRAMPPSCASRRPVLRSRCRSMATAGIATCIRAKARSWRWPNAAAIFPRWARFRWPRLII